MMNSPTDANTMDQADDPAAPSNEICLPMKALDVDGTSPAEGDTVEFQTTARVIRIAGDNVYVQPTAANGEPLPEEAAETNDNAGEENEESIRAKASALDDEEALP